MRLTCRSCRETFHEDNMFDCPRCLGEYCHRCRHEHLDTCTPPTRPSRARPAAGSSSAPVLERIGEADEGAPEVYVERGEDARGRYAAICLKGELGTARLDTRTANAVAWHVDPRDPGLAARLREASETVRESTKTKDAGQARMLAGELAVEMQRWDADLAARLRDFAQAPHYGVREEGPRAGDRDLAYRIVGYPDGAPQHPWAPPPGYDPLA